LFRSQTSEEADDLEGGINGSSEKKKEAKVAENAPHAVGRVAGVVAESVGDTTQNPNQTRDSRVNRAFQSSDKQQKQELRVVFERVLMRSLNAVKERILVRVHLRVGNIHLLTCLTDSDALPHDHEY